MATKFASQEARDSYAMAILFPLRIENIYQRCTSSFRVNVHKIQHGAREAMLAETNPHYTIHRVVLSH